MLDDKQITISKLEFMDKAAKSGARFAKELFEEDVKSAHAFSVLFSAVMSEIVSELFDEKGEKNNEQYN